MAIKFNDTSNMCRCNRKCELYKTPSSFNSIVLDDMYIGKLFISNRSAELTNGMTLLQISESEYLSSDILGMWVNVDACDIIPIEDDDNTDITHSADGSYDINVCLSITGNKILIYSTSTGRTPLNSGLKLGDIVFCDKKINISYNGIDETRYHIKAVSDGVDESVIDCWILANFSVTDNTKVNIFNVAAIQPRAAAYIYNTPTTLTDPASSYAAISGATVSSTSADPTDDQRVTESTSAIVDKAEATAKSNGVSSISEKSLYYEYGMSYLYSSGATHWMNIPLGRMLFVHGMPFQYTGYTDRRGYSEGGTPKTYGLENTSDYKQVGDCVDMYGRVFAKELVANTPVAIFVPGVPKFLTSLKVGIFATKDSSGSLKDSWVPLWLDSSDEQQFNEMIQSGNGNYDYFSLDVDTTDYYKYVNAACRTSAKLMGLSDVKYRGKACDKIDWGKYNSSADQEYGIFEEIVGLDGGVSFAFDPQSSITDTISNTTGDSQLAGMLNQASAKVKEAEFLAGGGLATEILNMGDNDYESAAPEMKTGVWGVGQRISSLFKNTVSGLNVRFPEIWQDSSNSKSYSIEMKFVTPYANAFCEWRYVLVPFFHIFNLAAPRSSSDANIGSNSYKSPFLIRAFSKGYFNVEMGIIETLTWRRFGDGDMMGENGVPTQIDVTVDFKDLYHTLSTTKFGDSGFGNVGLFFNNTGLMDMIGTLSGVNMNRLTLSERIAMYTSASTSVFGSMGSNFVRHFTDRTRNIVEKHLFGT